MSKEKQSKSTQEFDAGRETRVLLEQIRSEVRTVSEQHGSIMGKLQEHDQKFANMEVRFDHLEMRFNHMETRFNHMETRFGRVEKVITGVMSDHETRIKRLEVKTAL